MDKTKPKQYNKAIEIKDLRADEVKPSLSIDEVLKDAPEKRDRYFVVPQVVE
jgi:aspartyl/glutamyl-tRNA(Asn/Gln) amidotransferase C subunit